MLAGMPTAELLERRGTRRAARRRVPGADVRAGRGPAAGGRGRRRRRGVGRGPSAALRGTDAFVVYLHTPVEVLVQRVGDGAGRPFLQPDPESALRRLFAGREPLYREVADLVVDTSSGDAESHADQVVQALRDR